MKKNRKYARRRLLNANMNLEEYKEQLRSIKLAIAIKNVLDLRKMSVAEFATLMGKDKAVVNKWLSGSYHFSLATLYEISQGLGIL